jgi:hypothetical protein
MYAQSNILNYNLRGTVSAPAAWGVSLSLGSPTSVSGSEMSTSNISTRQTALFAAATTVAGSAYCSNTSSMNWSSVSAASISGLAIWDTMLSNNSGNMLWYGLLAAPRTLSANDAIVIAVGALTCALS